MWLPTQPLPRRRRFQSPAEDKKWPILCSRTYPSEISENCNRKSSTKPISTFKQRWTALLQQRQPNAPELCKQHSVGLADRPTQQGHGGGCRRRRSASTDRNPRFDSETPRGQTNGFEKKKSTPHNRTSDERLQPTHIQMPRLVLEHATHASTFSGEPGNPVTTKYEHWKDIRVDPVFRRAGHGCVRRHNHSANTLHIYLSFCTNSSEPSAPSWVAGNTARPEQALLGFIHKILTPSAAAKGVDNSIFVPKRT